MALSIEKMRSACAELGLNAKAMRAASAQAENLLPCTRHHASTPSVNWLMSDRLISQPAMTAARYAGAWARRRDVRSGSSNGGSRQRSFTALSSRRERLATTHDGSNTRTRSRKCIVGTRL